MIDHIGINVRDMSKSRPFYEAALAPIGYAMRFEVPKEHTGGITVLGFGENRPDFWISERAPQAKMHVAFRAESRRAVDAFYHAGLAAGGRDNGAPGPRPHYHKDYYGAFLLDPDGHNVEVVCHAPA